MSGLILLLALIACAWAGVWLVRFVGRVIPNAKWKNPAMVGLALLLVTAPFVDEVIGKYQFEALCKANGIEGADVSKARGKRIKLEVGERHLLGGTIMPIYGSDWVNRDAESGEILFQYKNYYAKGGWLMRYTPFSMGSHHSMFPGNGCDYNVTQRIRNDAQMTVIN